MSRPTLVLRAAALAALLAASGLGAACGGGISSDQATTWCDQERMDKGACLSDAVYSSCVSCYEMCGSACRPTDTCPASYACQTPSH